LALNCLNAGITGSVLLFMQVGWRMADRVFDIKRYFLLCLVFAILVEFSLYCLHFNTKFKTGSSQVK